MGMRKWDLLIFLISEIRKGNGNDIWVDTVNLRMWNVNSNLTLKWEVEMRMRNKNEKWIDICRFSEKLKIPFILFNNNKNYYYCYY